MSDNPEKESPSSQARAYIVSSIETTGGTITVPGLLSKKEKEHGGWFAISEHSFRLIERSFDTPALRRKAQAMLVTLHRIANLRGVRTFVAEIADIARDVNYSYCEAESGIQLLEILKLVEVKRRQIPGTKLKAPSEYTVHPPVFQNKTPIDGNHLSIEECSKSGDSPRIPKNSSKNNQELSLCGADGEKGEQAREEQPPGERESDFEVFWKAYPRKDAKVAARKAWEEAKDRPPIDHILAAIRVHKKTRFPDQSTGFSIVGGRTC
jgi:hypothetical protein